MNKFGILCLLSFLSLGTFADLNLKSGYNELDASTFLREIGPGERITLNLKRPHYVEELMIFAKGMQANFSFADVYADGELVSTLGVPGVDPDYPVVIREKVQKIEIVSRVNSKIEILDFQIFTKRKNYESYARLSHSRTVHYNIENWGKNSLDTVYEFYYSMRDHGVISTEDFIKYIQPIKRMAINTQAIDNARSADSLKTFKLAYQLALSIEKATPLLDRTFTLMSQNLDSLVIDLKTIKEDICERYDIDLNE